MTKKWDDPQLDAAQFAIDRFSNAKQTVSDQMAEIYQSIRDGTATDEDRKRLKNLREQYIALSKEVEDVMGLAAGEFVVRMDDGDEVGDAKIERARLVMGER
jgi:hypothetical protein